MPNINIKTTPKITRTATASVSVAAKNNQPTEKELNAASTQISAITSVIQLNIQLRNAIAQYWANFPVAMERLKIAVQENWRCNLTGVLVKALKEGMPSEDTKAPCTFYGWKEWANEATKRRLMKYCHSYEDDIMVHFVGGASRLILRGQRIVVV